ncbi:MAG: hypothetical protein ACYDEE_06190 [Ignavibacteriaceae bacterium]
MEAIIVDKNNFTNKLSEIFEDDSRIIDSKDESSYQVSTKISSLLSHVASKETKIFINIEGNYDNGARLNQKGVEILLWLRFKYKITNPVVMYSFQSNKDLLYYKPEHVIIDSEGCYYIRLPYDFTKLKELKLADVRDIIRLKKFVKHYFNIEEHRHSEANWWGAYRLYNIYNKLFSDKFNIEIFENKKNTLSTIVAEFVYSKNDEDLYNLKRQYLKNIEFYRNQIQKMNPVILYIDDKAEFGWSIILKKLLKIEKPQNFISIVPDKKENLEQQIISTIQNYPPSVVLLDLRLFDEKDSYSDILNYSGAKILKKIKEDYLYLPIIMFTASNKAYNMKKLIQLGSEAMWTKEGIDEGIDNKRTVVSVLEFLQLIYGSIIKFKYPIEKKFYETDINLSKLEKYFNRLNINKLKENNILKKWLGYNYIFTDTNIWIETGEITSYYSSLYILFRISSIEGTTFQIIDDVLLEIMKFSKKHVSKKEEINKILASRFALEKIWNWYNYKKKLIGSAAIENYKAKMTLETSEIIEHSDIVFKTDKWYSKISELLGYKSKELSISKTKISHTENKVKVKSKIETVDNKHKGDLHADDTFLTIIPQLLKEGKSVLLITNDKKFIHDKLNPSINILEKDIKEKFEFINGSELVQNLLQSINFLTNQE